MVVWRLSRVQLVFMKSTINREFWTITWRHQSKEVLVTAFGERSNFVFVELGCRFKRMSAESCRANQPASPTNHSIRLMPSGFAS
jgi:hypothetical protein